MDHTDRPGSLASTLHDRLKDTMCVVKLMRGRDHLGMARMEIEEVYADDEDQGTTVFRVVGRHRDATDHSMLGLPYEASAGIAAHWDDDHVALRSGDFEMVIHPADQQIQ